MWQLISGAWQQQPVLEKQEPTWQCGLKSKLFNPGNSNVVPASTNANTGEMPACHKRVPQMSQHIAATREQSAENKALYPAVPLELWAWETEKSLEFLQPCCLNNASATHYKEHTLPPLENEERAEEDHKAVSIYMCYKRDYMQCLDQSMIEETSKKLTVVLVMQGFGSLFGLRGQTFRMPSSQERLHGDQPPDQVARHQTREWQSHLLRLCEAWMTVGGRPDLACNGCRLL